MAQARAKARWISARATAPLAATPLMGRCVGVKPLRVVACGLLLMLATACSHMSPRDHSSAKGNGLGLAAPKPATIPPVEAATQPDPGSEQTADSEALDSLQTARETADLFARIRQGFALPNMDHPSVDREINWYANHPDYLDRTFRRGERYLHYIVCELEARNMPLELALLPVVESAFNPIAYSRARAAGLWQFIPSTGARYGLKQNFYYDGRRDVIEATRAALDYLQFLAEEFEGDWLLAIAAYNAGEASVSRAVERNKRLGLPTDFFSLNLPRETEAYVPKLLAMRRIVHAPEMFGLEFAPIANHPYFTKIDVGSPLDMGVAAELADMPRDDLLALNPAFNRSMMDPDGPHYVLVPSERAAGFRDKLAVLPDSERVRTLYHRAARGETLVSIARHYGVSPESLRAANNLRGAKVHAGQNLVIVPGMSVSSPALEAQLREPPPGRKSSRSQSSVYTVRAGETLWSIARSHGVTAQQLAMHNGLQKGEALNVGKTLVIPHTATLASNNPGVEASLQRLTYTVRAGDTLSQISNSFRVSVPDIMTWNKMTSAHALKHGQRLVLYVDDTRRNGG
jgi:membrane-bound lytic murein transglycosylase D